MARAPVIAVVVLLLGVPLAADAAPILHFLGGEVLGSGDVKTGASSYEVRPVDGSCATPVSGCEGVSDFAFPSFGALTAVQAFVDHATLDRGLEQLDTHRELQAGCDAHVFGCAGSTLQGNEFRPDFLNAALSANAASRTGGVIFDSPPGTPDIAGPLPVDNEGWAASMPSVALVATLVLTGSALVSLRLLRRRRRSRRRRRRRVQ